MRPCLYAQGRRDTWNNDGTWQPDADGDGQGDIDQMQQALEDAGYNVGTGTNPATGRAGVWIRVPGSPDDLSNPAIEVNVSRVWVNISTSFEHPHSHADNWSEFYGDDSQFAEIQFSESDPFYSAHAGELLPVFGVTAPDGATYYAPIGFDYDRIVAAIEYLQSIQDYHHRLTAFYNMYTDRDHPHFLDLKELPGPRISYFSDATGTVITASAYEAFGNYLYGFVGRLGGIGSGDLRYAAGVTQAGDRNVFSRDSPEDAPHVTLGIQDAERYVRGEYSGPVPREPGFPGEPRDPTILPTTIG